MNGKCVELMKKKKNSNNSIISFLKSLPFHLHKNLIIEESIYTICYSKTATFRRNNILLLGKNKICAIRHGRSGRYYNNQ